MPALKAELNTLYVEWMALDDADHGTPGKPLLNERFDKTLSLLAERTVACNPPWVRRCRIAGRGQREHVDNPNTALSEAPPVTFANDPSLNALVAATQSGSLAWPVSKFGLSAPVRPTALALEGTMAEFVTLEQMVGQSASIDEIVGALNRFTQDASLIACAQVLHGLFRHPQGMKAAQQELIGMLPSGWEARFRSLPATLPAVERVVATPQAILNLAKLVLTRHQPATGQREAMPFHEVLPLGMAMASHLERHMLEEEDYWGAKVDLFAYMFASHYLFAHADDAAQIARARALEDLRRQADEDLAATYDEVFRKSTGASPAAARVLASSFWTGSQTGPLLSETYGSKALFTEEEREAAIATVAADADTLKSLIGAEHRRLGASPTALVSWAFNSFRQSPVVRLCVNLD